MLDEIGCKFLTDKSSIAHNFLHSYEEVLKGVEVKTLVEVGIFDGASLRMWSEFYPSAKIIGLEIDTSRLINEGNISSYFCDQSNTAMLLDVLKNLDIDVFVDDGSHIWSHQINTFKTVYPLMKEGSVYIAEDLHTSMLSEYKDIDIVPLDFFRKEGFAIVENGVYSITGIKVKGDK